MPTLQALDPDEGFMKDGALTVGVHMSVIAQVFLLNQTFIFSTSLIAKSADFYSLSKATKYSCMHKFEHIPFDFHVLLLWRPDDKRCYCEGRNHQCACPQNGCGSTVFIVQSRVSGNLSNVAP